MKTKKGIFKPREPFMCYLSQENKAFVYDLSALTGLSNGKICDLAIELLKKKEIRKGKK
jgi:hypothetical protein